MAKAERSGGILETIKTVVYALLIAGVFRTLFFQPFWIPSGSMKDTLLVGDFLFVNKMAYGYSYASCPSLRFPRFGIDIGAEDICGIFDGDNSRLFGSEPERGDVVVFRHPVTGQDYIKRLIGLPGETVQVRGGVLYIDGQEAPQTPAGTFTETYDAQGPMGNRPQCANPGVPLGGVCEKPRFRETLPGGVEHDILNIRTTQLDDTPVYTVPEGHYFFMGDNRDNSTDSRVSPVAGGVGFVPYENLIGRAGRVVLSFGGTSIFKVWDWRFDRFLEPIE
ncbi:signal peptidase I [Palleronia sediminis]|uniref:Signal peptidase I n=1 Tax=Palleronia sediminis TaxID=2547833 RepID=A0A4R5ZXL9_9RHOB|nr:signal peptidase I [Palleronia sediminis]TDL74994.1 signal peptidase I [Palleronia sediminis]